MTNAAEFLADAGRRSLIVDGRYSLPHPVTGKPGRFTRVTTFTRTLRDPYRLERWHLRMAGRGLAERDDLCVSILADYDDDDAVAKAVDQAMEHAGTSRAATKGTAMHRFTEQLDRGEKVRVPEHMRADLTAYEQTLDEHGLTVELIEQIVFVPGYELCGQVDRVLRDRHGNLLIGDLKTGAELKYGWLEHGPQVGAYSRGSHLWDAAAEEWRTMPAIDQHRAVIIHLPVGTGRCELVEVDLDVAWAAVEECAAVRQWRKRTDEFHRPYADTEPDLTGQLTRSLDARRAAATSSKESAGPEPAVEPSALGTVDGEAGAGDRADWLRKRLAALADDDRARRLVAAQWPQNTATRPPWSSSDMDALVAMLDEIERKVEASFSPPDPTRGKLGTTSGSVANPSTTAARDEPPVPVDDMTVVPDSDVSTLTKAIAELSSAGRVVLGQWAKDAGAAQRGFGAGAGMTRRTWLICRAAIALADWPTGAVVDAIDQAAGALDGWTIGVRLGTLDVEQAARLVDIADAGPDELAPF